MPGLDVRWEDESVGYQKARACYTKAVVEEFKERKCVVAFSDYLDALWIMDGLTKKRHFFSSSNHNTDYEHFTGLIYDRLAWLFYMYDAYGTSLECLEKSNGCFLMENNFLGVANNYELMGDVFLAQGDKINSLYYYRKSDSIHEKTLKDHGSQHFSSLYHKALDMYNVEEKHAAYDLLSHALEEADNSWLERQIRFSLGYLFFEDQQYDSALYNYERGFPLLPRQNIKAYRGIIKAANTLGMHEKAAHYGELLSDLYLDQLSKSGDRVRMIMGYESHKADSQNARQKDLFFFGLFIIVVLLLILVVDSYLVRRHKRIQKMEHEANERIKALFQDEIETTKRTTRQKEEKIRSLEDKLDKVITASDFQSLSLDKKLEALREMPISKRVVKVKSANVKAGYAYPEWVLSDAQTTMLVNAVDAVFPKFSAKIMERYPRLKRSDIVYCCMYILGLSEVQAAALMGKTYQAVWARSLKLHEVFGDKSDLQFALHGFLNNWEINS
ncbi:MAG: hypothetical protein IKG95_00145 [Bacteroidales bacterium]|nr:hypothetical protein [Bacteroidales bacterium]